MSHDTPRPATPRRDERPRRGGWAPGDYFCRCQRCQTDFLGDKRACECADCAYAAAPEEKKRSAHPGANELAALARLFLGDSYSHRDELQLLRRYVHLRLDAFLALRTRIDLLLETYMSELHDAFAALETSLSQLEADEAQAESTITADDAQIVDLRAQITDLQAQLAEAQAGASDLTPAEVNAAAARLATMETRLHALLNPTPPPIEVVTPPEVPPTPPSDGAAPGVGITSARPDDQPLGEPASTEQTPVGQG